MIWAGRVALALIYIAAFRFGAALAWYASLYW